MGCAGAVAVPRRTDDDCFGVREVYAGRAVSFEASEVALLNELAADLAFGVATLRTRGEYQRQQSNIALLTRVLKMQSAINSAVLRIPDRNLPLPDACRVPTQSRP